jgi:group I intron endonuclease
LLNSIVYMKLSPENIKDIFKENKGKSGVYCWKFLVTEASYVENIVDLTRRLRDYFSPLWLKKELLKNNSLIYKALLKYDYAKFSLEILKYCDKMSTINREQYYIDLLEPEYNLCLKSKI